jgi:hypothetical protein
VPAASTASARPAQGTAEAALPANAVDRLFGGARDDGPLLFSATARASRRPEGDGSESVFGNA